MNRTELLAYAESVHLAIFDKPIQRMSYTSDHPYQGADIDTLKELVDADLVKKQVRAFEKDLMSEIQPMYDQYKVDTPVKVTKGSKDKRGIEGFILHAQEPLQGSGKALFVYDVLTNKSCMVRSSATKARIPKAGERDILKETYAMCKHLSGAYTNGVRVELKADTSRKGVITKSAHLDPNLAGSGFFLVNVQWNDHQSPSNGTYILTELNRL
tara:strand:+ start:1840 stop:2478 length:639 start_codon:yes stop_codon:yes gene_type:complete